MSQLMESVLGGERTAHEASDTLEINLAVIQRVAGRMTEPRLGLPPTPPDGDDDLIEHFARRVYLVSSGDLCTFRTVLN